VPGVERLPLACWFLGSAATELADFPPEFVAELRPDLAKIGPLGLLAHCLPCWRILGASVPQWTPAAAATEREKGKQ